jgi:hypothetical protein
MSALGIKEAVEGAEQAAPDDPREEIQLSEEYFNKVVRRCAALLRDRIYLRGVLPFAITRAAEVAGGQQIEDDDGAGVDIDGIRHRPGSLVFTAATHDRTAYWLDEAARFMRFDQRSEKWRAVTCPSKVAQRIIGVASEVGFRACSGVARTPLFIDGEVVAVPGWNARTRMILDLPTDLPAIPDAPTRRDAKQALETLLLPFRGYLQDNPALKPLFAAAALTAALRASLQTAPAIVLDGNTIGAGKGKAVRALAVIGTGGLPAMTAEGHNDEETEKRIAAAILQGAAAILLDNLQRVLASTTLESILTDPVARIRKFGSLSDDVVTECRALVLITANNATLRRDLLRRTLPIRLVVPSDKPELRRFDFDPVDEARRCRGEILAAAFTIAKAWHRKREQPEHAHIRAKTLGSFESWADLVAGAVHWLTGVNPIDAIEERKENDTTDATERGVVWQLANRFPWFPEEKTFTAADAATMIDVETWRLVIPVKGERPTGHAVGNWLKRRRDRRFSVAVGEEPPKLLTLEIVATDHKGTALWAVKHSSSPGNAEHVRQSTPSKNNGLGEERRTAPNSSIRTRESWQPIFGFCSALFGSSANGPSERRHARGSRHVRPLL